MDLDVLLVGQMEHNALAQPDDTCLRWLDAAGRESITTFREFRDAVVRKASWLAHHTRVQKGDRVVLCVQPGPDYIVSLLAILYLGAVAVPAYPVPFFQRPSWMSAVFEHIAREVAPAFILADEAIAAHRLKASAVGWLLPTPGGRTPWIIAGEDDRPLAAAELTLEDEAIIQYTSGTTGATPKGAILTHGNLLSQFLFIGDTCRDRSDVHGFAWVPPYHDLGLFMAVFTTIMFGFRFTAVSPVDFLRDPLSWFDHLSRHRITHTAAPNFAYALCLDRLRETGPEALARWDLSHLVSLGSGGEPIDHGAMKALLDLLQEHCGLRPDAFTPCYGLAEAGCAVTIEGHQLVWLDPDQLHRGPALRFVTADAQHAIAVYGCGTIEQDGVAIVGPAADRLGEDRLGEIRVSSPSLAHRYIERDATVDLTRRLASGEPSTWLATGALGFVHRGELVVLGRRADLIPLGERTFFPHHIEAAVNETGGLRKGNTTAYAAPAAHSADPPHLDPLHLDTLHIAVELRGTERRSDRTTAHAIAAHLRERFGLTHPVVVHFMPPRSAIRTTSGKLVRHRTAAAIAAGTIRTTSYTIDAESPRAARMASRG